MTTERRNDITKEVLDKLYNDDGLSSIAIAEKLNCGKSSILRRMKKFGITRRTVGEALSGKTIPEEVRKKMSESTKAMQQGSSHSCWKGGRLRHHQGYILIWKKDHPCAESKGYVLEHRLVMEGIIGRILRPEEVVHHINSKRDDNRPENLMLFKNHAEHMKFHEEETGLGFQF